MGEFTVRYHFQSCQILCAPLTMKSLSAAVISSEPISVKAASRILTRFVSKENGASKAVSSYLKRTCVSINELIQFHRELKSHKPNRRHEKSAVENVNDGNLTEGVITPLKEKESRTDTEIVAVERKKRREELNNETENRKSKKKRKVMEVSEKGEANENEEHQKKKKKRKRSHEEE
ncbi:uncharacterized protein [Aristolochia californica]|uniref:uncharacterized protein n=1 Tax=Aristolochia californica TaxID=171875 RepID=UPI0035E113B7